jgi:hypothetical protein
MHRGICAGQTPASSSVFSAVRIAEYVPGNYRSLAPGLHHSTKMGMIDRGAESRFSIRPSELSPVPV